MRAPLIDTVSGNKIDTEDGKKLFTAAEDVPLNGASDTMETNEEFQGGAGLQPKIHRKAASKCCKWCDELAGDYNYPNVPHDVYRRHKNCRCTVEYDPGTGRRQNVHTKRWSDENAHKATQSISSKRLQNKAKDDTIKTKYAPSPQRQKKGVQVSPKKYAMLTGTLNTRFPNLHPEDGVKTIFDGNYSYMVEADGYGGMIILKRLKLK